MDDSLAVLLLPGKLEEIALLREQARDLLEIPRVVALEPSRMRTPRFMRNSASVRQARRLRFPGRVRLLVLYDPTQYLLARGLLAEYSECELWYIRPDDATLAAARSAMTAADAQELESFDNLARERAVRILPVVPGEGVDETPLRERLRELEVINPRAFVPDEGWRRKGSRRGR
ncbi:MAG TPA: hypothetical protein VE127_12075 [Solirubrobacteraceae bacterium]|nr:hypothetical protein [Solirubrobacteraceae bacterium]